MKTTLQRLSALLVALVASVATFAYDACIDGIYYNLVSKAKQAEVTSGDTKYTGDIIIPETISYNGEDYTVKIIGSGSFYDAFNISSISIPKTITKINSEAFYRNYDLKYVQIADLECWCRTEIIDSNPLIYAEHLFLNGTEIKDLIIPESITSINDYIFEGGYFDTVTIPNSVTNIGFYSFAYCRMKNISLPNSITNIEEYAFLNCANLLSITLPKSLKKINSQIFCNCYSLQSIEIGNSITEIGDEAFKNCSSLECAKIGNSVQKIRYMAFRDCKKLKNIYLGSNLSEIGVLAFSLCSNIENIYCLAETPPSFTGSSMFTPEDAFKDAYIEYTNLFVPQKSIDLYQSISPWSKFGTIQAIDTGQEPAAPDTCATPTISVVNGKLHFECETEGAEIYYSIELNSNNVSGKYSEDVDFATTPTYTVTCYATADGYIQSETATATITIDKADVNADGKVDISDVNKVVSVICGAE